MWDLISPGRSLPEIIPRNKSEYNKRQRILPPLDINECKEHDILKFANKSMEVVNSSGSIRELEVLVFDIKEKLETKMKVFMDEFAGKLKRELLTIQNRDESMWKDIELKTNNLSESIDISKESYNGVISALTGRINALCRKSDEAELKLTSLEKSIEQIATTRNPLPSLNLEEKVNERLQDELNALKGAFQDEKKRTQDQIDELFRGVAEIESQSHSRFNTISQSLQRIPKALPIEPIRSIKSPNREDRKYIESRLTILERQLQEETNKRIKLEDAIIKYLDDKVLTVKTKIQQEEKGTLEREKKLIGNIQEGLVTVNHMLRDVNEHNTLKLNKVETEIENNIHILGQLLEAKIKVLEASIVQQKEEMKVTNRKLIKVEETAAKNLEEVSKVLSEDLGKIDDKLIESYKILNKEQEKLLLDLKAQKQEMTKTNEELMQSITSIKDKLEVETKSSREKLEEQSKLIEGIKLMLKFDLEEAKKRLYLRLSLHEKSNKDALADLDKRLFNKIDGFTIYIDEKVCNHSKKVNEALSEQVETIEKNKKLLDQHIIQQANTIKSLSRAFTEKEAAERKDAIDELANKVTKKFIVMEKEMNSKILKVEIEAKHYTELKVEDMKQEIVSDIESKLVIEKILATLDSEEKTNQILILNNKIEENEKRILELNERIVNLKDDIKTLDVNKEVTMVMDNMITDIERMELIEKNNIALNDLEAEINSIEVNTGVGIVMSDILHKVETQFNLESIQRQIDNNEEGLRAQMMKENERVQMNIENLNIKTEVSLTVEHMLNAIETNNLNTIIEENLITNNENLRNGVKRVKDDIEVQLVMDSILNKVEVDSFNEKLSQLRGTKDELAKIIDKLNKEIKNMNTSTEVKALVDEIISKVEIDDINDQLIKNREAIYTHLKLEITELNDRIETTNEELDYLKTEFQVFTTMRDIINAVDSKVGENINKYKELIERIDADLRNEIIKGAKSEATLNVIQSVIVKLKETIESNNEKLEILNKEINDEVVKSEAHRTVIDTTLKAVEKELSELTLK